LKKHIYEYFDYEKSCSDVGKISNSSYLEDTPNDLTQGVFSQRKQMLSLLDIIKN